MSSPAAPRPVARGADSGEELERFRAWLRDRGYAAATARLWCARVRDAHGDGVGDPDAVDAAYPNHRANTRAGLRAALLMFAEFREGRCGGSS